VLLGVLLFGVNRCLLGALRAEGCHRGICCPSAVTDPTSSAAIRHDAHGAVLSPAAASCAKTPCTTSSSIGRLIPASWSRIRRHGTIRMATGAGPAARRAAERVKETRCGGRGRISAALPDAAGSHTATRFRLGGGCAHPLASEDCLAREDEPRAASLASMLHTDRPLRGADAASRIDLIAVAGAGHRRSHVSGSPGSGGGMARHPGTGSPVVNVGHATRPMRPGVSVDAHRVRPLLSRFTDRRRSAG
jgi:hypothetical protein